MPEIVILNETRIHNFFTKAVGAIKKEHAGFIYCSDNNQTFKETVKPPER